MIDSIPLIHISTPESNGGLRDLVVSHAKIYATVLRTAPYKEKFKQVLQEVPDFKWELLGEYAQQTPEGIRVVLPMIHNSR